MILLAALIPVYLETGKSLDRYVFQLVLVFCSQCTVLKSLKSFSIDVTETKMEEKLNACRQVWDYPSFRKCLFDAIFSASKGSK